MWAASYNDKSHMAFGYPWYVLYMRRKNIIIIIIILRAHWKA